MKRVVFGELFQSLRNQPTTWLTQDAQRETRCGVVLYPVVAKGFATTRIGLFALFTHRARVPLGAIES